MFNANCSLSRIGFFGSSLDNVYATTHVEGLVAWSLATVRCPSSLCEPAVASACDDDTVGRQGDGLATIDDARPLLAAGGIEVNYIVDCSWLPALDTLAVVAGNDE